ncbi:MAG: NUDIX domain-containing protein [Bacteroidales bacterium]
MNKKIEKFNIRVYGIVIEGDQILLTDEFRMGIKMTKFPGGGLEFGEGTRDCLKREFQEEINQEVQVKEHFYTTDYFQPTFLLSEPQQLLSIYYLVKVPHPEKIITTSKEFDFQQLKEGEQTFRWVEIKKTDPEKLTFPIDKLVFKKIKQTV